jgi:hypothetical protein
MKKNAIENAAVKTVEKSDVAKNETPIAAPHLRRYAPVKVPSSVKSVSEVYVTNDYDIFKLFKDGNRAVDQSHLNKLRDLTQQHGQLKIPIIVNEQYEIIDGQHRFSIWKEKGLPVYFIINQGYGFDEIVVLNNFSKRWVNDDFVKVYSEDQKITDYVILDKFVKEFKDENGVELFKLNAARILLSFTMEENARQKVRDKDGKMSSVGIDILRKGKFKVSNIERSIELAKQLIDLRPFLPFSFNHTRFIRAFLGLFGTHTQFYKYDHQQMLAKMDTFARSSEINRKKLLMKSNSVVDFKRLLFEIYNFNRRNSDPNQLILELRNNSRPDGDFSVK